MICLTVIKTSLWYILSASAILRTLAAVLVDASNYTYRTVNNGADWVLEVSVCRSRRNASMLTVTRPCVAYLEGWSSTAVAYVSSCRDGQVHRASVSLPSPIL